MKPVRLFLACALAGVGLLSGCKESEPPAATQPVPHDSDRAATRPADTGGQTLCPIMGDQIDPAVFTEHEGKRVYFCCESCIKDFKADPAKYVTKLPQFGGKEEPAKAS